MINLPAIFIIWVVAGLLIAGTRESATLNAILVVIKIAALALFVAVALPVFNASHFEPFMPFGFPRSGPSGSEVGVMAAAAIIFFAFYGFDAIATAAEEAKNPSRDLAIGIVGSMVVCVVIYMVVAAAAIGAVAYTGFANSPEPLALILREIGQPWAARVLGASAVIALPTVILAFFYGQSRIFFTVARDGLLPPALARVSSRGTPVRITIFTAIVTSIFAGLIPLTAIAALANAGTLAAFIAVCAAMLVLRRREPDRERKFRAPAAVAGGDLRHSRLPVSVHQPAQPDAAVLRGGAGDRPDPLRDLRQPRRRASPGRRCPWQRSSTSRRLKNIVGGSAGNLVEWFDWYVYSAFALYFASSFFPKGDQTAQLLQTSGDLRGRLPDAADRRLADGHLRRPPRAQGGPDPVGLADVPSDRC